MNYDARYVYLDGLKGFYGDWQSPVMTWLWKTDRSDRARVGQHVPVDRAYSTGSASARCRCALVRRSRAAAIALPLIALTPPLFAFVGIIWRDVLMAACWLLAAAIVFVRQRPRRTPARQCRSWRLA